MRKRPILFGCIFFFAIVLVLILAISITSSWDTIGGKNFMSRRSNHVAVVFVKGVMVDPKHVMDTIIAYRKNPKVKAVVIRVESPGGTVGTAQEIYREILKLKKEKPTVASLGNVAASGGYYVASACDRIVANPGTVTGSIGVIIELTNFEQLLKWAKIKSEVIKSGDYKDMGSPLRDLKEEERALLKDFVDNVHDQFVRAVAEGREMSHQDVSRLATGMIFSGEQALEKGLVDELGNLQDAIDIAAKLAGIEDEPEVIYPPKRRPSVMDLIFGGNDYDNYKQRFIDSNIHVMYLWQTFALGEEL